jgi:hypothetical protein
VIVEGSFGPESANAEFRRLNKRLPFDALQIYCTAPSDVLYERYASRAPDRHPGHVAGPAWRLEEVRAGLEDGRWKPLDLGDKLLTVDTTAFPIKDLGHVFAAARSHVA